MDKDLIIYEEDTMEVVAIIPDAYSDEVVLKNGLNFKIVDANRKNLKADLTTNKIYFIDRSSKNKIINLDDYR